MNKSQYDRLNGAVNPLIAARSLPTDKTLLVGYTCARETFHVYTWNGILNVVVLNTSGLLVSHLAGGSLRPEQLVPDKRVYPEYTDFNLATRLRDRGISVPFTTWDDKRFSRVSLADNPFIEAGCECNMSKGQHYGFAAEQTF